MTNPATRYIQVQATSFSGTTLLATLLGAHPAIATVGELSGLVAGAQLESYRCSCGELLGECPFWQAVTAQMQHRGFAFDVAHFDTEYHLGPPSFWHSLRYGSSGRVRVDQVRDNLLRLWPPAIRPLQRLSARNQALAESVLAVTGAQVFVDTSKEALRLRALSQFSTLDIRVIHWVRDVRGFMASVLRRRGAAAFEPALARWVRFHRRTQRVLTTWPADAQIRVRYEDLCRDPQATLATLWNFCGVAVEQSLAWEQRPPQHIIGNPMRLRDLATIKVDERWKQQLTHPQLQRIAAKAGALNRFFGYEW